MSQGSSAQYKVYEFLGFEAPMHLWQKCSKEIYGYIFFISYLLFFAHKYYQNQDTQPIVVDQKDV